MVRLALLLNFVFTACTMAQTSQPAWQSTDSAQIILRPFEHAPYPHKSREDGFKRGDKIYPRDPHYTDSTIGIVIPTGYVPGESVDYIVYFHGHGSNVASTIKQYKLPEQLLAAKVNAIMIVPQGPKNAGDSGGGKLELDPGAFAKLIEEVGAFLVAEKKIKSPVVGRIVLSTHSGGYKVTAAVLDHGGMTDHITDVLLLDSSYGSLPWFAQWCKKARGGRLVSLFTEHLADENTELMALLEKDHTAFKLLMRSDDPKPEIFSPRMPLFMPTGVAHNLIATQFFGTLIQTSALAKN